VVKILSQSGNSLADLYDVEGSVAGIDSLETRELPIVHEMASTVFSERCSGAIRIAQTAALAQNAAADVVLTDLPSGVWRILNVVVFADVNARTSSAQVSLREPIVGREIPIFAWDSTNDVQTNIRIVEDGAAAANVFVHVSNFMNVPTMGIGAGQPQRVGEIAFRVLTSAFGAGTVTMTALIYLALSAIGGVPGNTTSRGLPVPSW